MRSGLQGWATIENLSGQNWKEIELTLVSGRPVAFHQALYEAYYVTRPEIPVEVAGRLMPNVDRGGVNVAGKVMGQPAVPAPAQRNRFQERSVAEAASTSLGSACSAATNTSTMNGR